MKINKILALTAVFGCCMLTVPALAQSDETSTESTESTENSENVGNERVTIDGETTTTTTEEESSTSTAAEPATRERIRIYSGKHDGNNVIYDPK
ncbi:MAG: hypothetical protein RL090_269 [Bacteroidota bacterium]|jgi:hypothetical protein